MQRRHFLLLGLGVFAPWARAGLQAGAARQSALRVVVQRDVYNDYLRFLAMRDPLSLKHYDGPHARRDIAELVFLQQALQRGGETRSLRLMPVDSTRRMLKMLHNDEADIGGSSLWKSYADDDATHLAASLPLVHEGEFIAGLYFPEHHPGLGNIRRDPSGITQCTAVCDSAWQSDVRTLKSLGSPVLLTDGWNSMLGMLKKKRADYVLAPFQPTADFSLDTGILRLKPVPGMKVILSGSRHFLMSRNAPGAAALAIALDAGLQAMKKEGLLQQAYRESGFYDTRVQNWRRLN